MEPHDYRIYFVNIDLRHQYGISVVESQTFLQAKRPQRRRVRRNGCFRRLRFFRRLNKKRLCSAWGYFVTMNKVIFSRWRELSLQKNLEQGWRNLWIVLLICLHTGTAKLHWSAASCYSGSRAKTIHWWTAHSSRGRNPSTRQIQSPEWHSGYGGVDFR